MNDLVKKIKSRGYWRVIIRPNNFNEKLIGSLSKCREIIQEVHVHIKGYYYPFYSYNNLPTNCLDYIELKDDMSFFLEYWRYYQSGMFIQYYGMIEDWQDQATLVRWQVPDNSLSVVSTVNLCTVIYEFASRLASKELLGQECTISIGLYGTKDRILVTEPRRHLFGTYKCNIENLPREQSYDTKDLITRASELSLEHTEWIFHRFNWEIVSTGILKQDQDNFLRG